MGYGSCALSQLQQYFEGKFPNLKESAAAGEDDEDDNENDEGEAKQVDDEVMQGGIFLSEFFFVSNSF